MGRGIGECKCPEANFQNIFLIVSFVFGVLLTLGGAYFLFHSLSGGWLFWILCGILILATGLVQLLFCVIALKNGYTQGKIVLWHIIIFVLCILVIVLFFLESNSGYGMSSFGVFWTIMDIVLCVIGIVLMLFVYNK